MLDFGPSLLASQFSRRQGPRTVKKPSCRNPTCSLPGNVASRRIIRYGFYRTTAGKRRRYRCVRCGHTFSTTKGTLYYRLQHRRTTVDTVVTLRVEGVSLSAIARIERLAWNTVARWLERAASVCRRFNQGRTTGFVATELQADEIRSFTGGGGGRPGRRGYSQRLRSGRVSGRRPSSDDAATETPWHLFATWRRG